MAQIESVFSSSRIESWLEEQETAGAGHIWVNVSIKTCHDVLLEGN